MTNAEIIEAATLGLAVYSLSDTELETVAGSPPASLPSNATSASSKSPVEIPLR